MTLVNSNDLLSLNFGPQHPSAHGVLRLILLIDGEYIVKANQQIYLFYRETEKLIEYKTYLQTLPYFDRLGYVLMMIWKHTFSLCVKQITSLVVPGRGQFMLMLFLGIPCILNYLMFLMIYIYTVIHMSNSPHKRQPNINNIPTKKRLGLLHCFEVNWRGQILLMTGWIQIMFVRIIIRRVWVYIFSGTQGLDRVFSNMCYNCVLSLVTIVLVSILLTSYWYWFYRHFCENKSDELFDHKPFFIGSNSLVFWSDAFKALKTIYLHSTWRKSSRSIIILIIMVNLSIYAFVIFMVIGGIWTQNWSQYLLFLITSFANDIFGKYTLAVVVILTTCSVVYTIFSYIKNLFSHFLSRFKKRKEVRVSNKGDRGYYI